jgi:PAS domain S-box-containing protein
MMHLFADAKSATALASGCEVQRMAELPHHSHPTDLRSLEQLAEEWPDAMLTYDGDHERFLYANKAAARLLGYPRETIRQLHAKDISHPDDFAQIADVRARADLDGWVRRPWRIVRKNGTVVQTELTVTRRRIDSCIISQAVFRLPEANHNGNGHTNGASDKRLEILDRTTLAVVTLDREGIITSWNAAAAEHFQMAADETVGRQVRDLARSEEDLADVESLMSPHEDRDEWISRLTIRRPNDEFEALVTCSAIRTENGELSGFLLITAPIDGSQRAAAPRMRRARVQCAACGREVAGTMRRKYCSEKCRQWAYYHRHLDAQRERSRQRHERRRSETEDASSQEGTIGAGSSAAGGR